jgi:hypothetical protein
MMLAARAARATRIHEIGEELMAWWNIGKRNPGEMAVNGGDTATGYEFLIERDGRTFTVAVSLKE